MTSFNGVELLVGKTKMDSALYLFVVLQAIYNNQKGALMMGRFKVSSFIGNIRPKNVVRTSREDPYLSSVSQVEKRGEK